MFESITDTASNIWSSVTDLWSSPKDEGPISVPVTAADEAAARQMVDRADAWEAAGHTMSPGDEQRARNEADWKARDAGFIDKADMTAHEEGSAIWQAQLDAYLAKKGPKPLPREEFIRNRNAGISY